VEKEHFLDLAQNYTSLSIEDAHAVDALQRAFPYSQVVHCLASRGARDHQFANATTLLALSAVYSTDRGVLKNIMTAPRKVRPSSTVKDHAVEEVAVEGAAETPVQLSIENSGLSGDALVEEIMMDLNRLQDLKRIFETSFQEYQHAHPNDTRKVEKTASAQRRPLPAPKAELPAPAVSKPARASKQPDVLLPEPSSEALLNQIESTHKRVAPDTRKQQEQLQIIDQFITKQPSIPKASAAAAEAADLTEKSASLTDSMVSETLVEILLRQGKKDKAIEVLRKLIWKFPQKKAIFAAQIEDLRK
jgi:hypothetical protein